MSSHQPTSYLPVTKSCMAAINGSPLRGVTRFSLVCKSDINTLLPYREDINILLPDIELIKC